MAGAELKGYGREGAPLEEPCSYSTFDSMLEQYSGRVSTART